MRDKDTIQDVLDDIEKRRHAKDPFQDKYLQIVLRPLEVCELPSPRHHHLEQPIPGSRAMESMTNDDDEGDDHEELNNNHNRALALKDSIFQISQQVRTRCELMNQMHKTLLKQVEVMQNDKSKMNKRRVAKSANTSKESETTVDVTSSTDIPNLDQPFNQEKVQQVYELYCRLNQSSTQPCPTLFDATEFKLPKSLLCQASHIHRKSRRQYKTRSSFAMSQQQLVDGLANLVLCPKTYTLLMDPLDVTTTTRSNIDDRGYDDEPLDVESIQFVPVESRESLDAYLLLEKFDDTEENVSDDMGVDGMELEENTSWSPPNTNDHNESGAYENSTEQTPSNENDNQNNHNNDQADIAELEKLTSLIIPVIPQLVHKKKNEDLNEEEVQLSERRNTGLLFNMSHTPDVGRISNGSLRLKSSIEENLLERRNQEYVAPISPPSLPCKFMLDLCTRRWETIQDFQSLLTGSFARLKRPSFFSNSKTVYETRHVTDDYIEEERNFLFEGMDIANNVLLAEEPDGNTTVYDETSSVGQVPTVRTNNKTSNTEKPRLDFALKLFSNLKKKNTFRSRVPITRISSLILKELQNTNTKTRLSDVTSAILVKHLNLEDKNSEDDVSPQRMFMALIHLAHHVSTQRSSQARCMTLEREESSNDIIVTWQQEKEEEQQQQQQQQ